MDLFLFERHAELTAVLFNVHLIFKKNFWCIFIYHFKWSSFTLFQSADSKLKNTTFNPHPEALMCWMGSAGQWVVKFQFTAQADSSLRLNLNPSLQPIEEWIESALEFFKNDQTRSMDMS